MFGLHSGLEKTSGPIVRSKKGQGGGINGNKVRICFGRKGSMNLGTIGIPNKGAHLIKG